MRGRAPPAAAALALAGALGGCSIALDFGPEVLLPSLDAGAEGAAPRDAAGDAVPADGAACPPGRGDCDRDPANGCETDLGGDVAHCGACGRACQGATTCAGGACVGGRPCAAPDTACGAACADLQSDPRHCGSCSVVCGAGMARCCRGACTNAPRCQ